MSLIKEERLDRIVRHLYQQEQMSVPELSTLLNVSPATIRRDIEQLVAKGLATRTHGGIVLPESAKLDHPVFQRRYLHADEKCSIGRTAAQLIHDDETVFLGSGSTVMEVAEHLKGKRNLTVITNSLPVCNLLAKETGISLVMTGGFLRSTELSLIGHIVETSLADLRADKAVMSIQGVHLQHGLTNNDPAETMVDRTIFAFAPALVLLADHTKLNKTKASFVAELSVVNTLITDRNAPTDFLEELERMGIDVIIAEYEDKKTQTRTSDFGTNSANGGAP
jgi:DeoR/GlpR family transcriptional regulator of sugar metabolism